MCRQYNNTRLLLNDVWRRSRVQSYSRGTYVTNIKKLCFKHINASNWFGLYINLQVFFVTRPFFFLWALHLAVPFSCNEPLLAFTACLNSCVNTKAYTVNTKIWLCLFWTKCLFSGKSRTEDKLIIMSSLGTNISSGRSHVHTTTAWRRNIWTQSIICWRIHSCYKKNIGSIIYKRTTNVSVKYI